MSVNFIMNSLFVVSEAIQRLVSLADGNLEMVLRCFQRIIDDPVYRQEVWLAMTTGRRVTVGIAKEDWTLRETRAMVELGLLEFDTNKGSDIEMGIRKAANGGKFGLNYYFVPADLTRKDLIELAYKVGIEVNRSSYCVGQSLPTKAEILDCDLSAIMTSTNVDHHPFLLGYGEHEVWARDQGGAGLTSVEETLYLIIRHFMTFGRILFMGGLIRCRNTHNVNESLSVEFEVNDGLTVCFTRHSNRDRHCGAIARKRIQLVVT